ncbi:MAG: hypothetical protein LBH59_05600 [Planctomycetaceae bacterium]|jgi:hypothetical protein|nr:hypothetical protein [Planctomycetaceae bacterium]
MENSNNDRWSLLAADLGIEVDSNKIENNTNQTEIENVKRNALVVVPDNTVTKVTTPEPKNTVLPSATPETLATPTTKILPTNTPTSTPNNTVFDNQKKKFTTSTNTNTKPLGNSSNNFIKPNTTKHSTHSLNSSANNSSFGAGILEPEEIAEVMATKNQVSDSANLKQEELTENHETFKPEPVKRSFFERLQQINIFGNRNKNDNTKNADENNTTTNENNNTKNIGDVKSEREHLPHGRYLPPHAQALYKAHTQSQPPTQQNLPQLDQKDQTQNSEKDVFDPLRQIATQISKLSSDATRNDSQKTENKNRTYNQYKKSQPNYNSTDKTDRYYSDTQTNINNSPESLFDDDLPETEEFAALRRLMGDGATVDEEQRRLASLLGDPKEEPETTPPTEQTFDNRTVSPYQQNRTSRYPNNRNYTPNNQPNNTKSDTPRTEHTNKRWTPTNNQTADKSTVVRGRRGSRFKGNNQKINDGINQNETNQQPNQSGTFTRQYWQTNGVNDSTISPNEKTATPTTGYVKQDQNWRGRRQPDNRNISDIQNDQTRYNSPHYLSTSQQPQNANYSSQVVNEIGAVDADYIDEYGEGLVSDEERLSFAQAHKNIPSWNDAVEPIVDANIQRHTRHYQNGKRR